MQNSQEKFALLCKIVSILVPATENAEFHRNTPHLHPFPQLLAQPGRGDMRVPATV
jgi:hypothetical protein